MIFSQIFFANDDNDPKNGKYMPNKWGENVVSAKAPQQVNSNKMGESKRECMCGCSGFQFKRFQLICIGGETFWLATST